MFLLRLILSHKFKFHELHNIIYTTIKTRLDINNKKPTRIEELFILSKSRYFESVEVLLTTNNDAYEKNNKKALVGTRVKGWVDLKKYKDGGGYLSDFVVKLKDKVE